MGELHPTKLSDCHFHTSSLNRDGSLKHEYSADEWRLVPLGHWNEKWNQAQSDYSTCNQELVASTVVLSSQSCLLGTNCILSRASQKLSEKSHSG